MATVQEFFRNPLVTWVTSFRTSSASENISDFADGVFLNEVMVEIDPTYFTLTRVHQNVDGDVNVRIQNLDFLVRHLKEFYQEKLQQLVLMRAPDVVAIAHCPDSDVGLQELVKLLLLMLGCAVQCDNKEVFIEKIKDMDFEVQKHLVEYIKQITDNANHVLTFRMSELQDSTIEHVLVVAESMFYQMGHIIAERDQSFTDNTHLRLEKDLLLQERQRAKSPRPFSPPPATGHLNVDSPSMAASKEKLRMLTEEMEEKNSLMAELKDELLASKKMLEKLRQENKDLSQDAVLVKAFRDQIDVLKVKADRVEKLETDAVKFKEKLRDLEYLKKRAEELKEENVILLDNRQLLREQLSSLSNKEERIEILEEENKKLKNHIHHIAEERQFEQEKLNEVMATNARLNIEKQESMAELASLTAEIDVLRGKSPSGSVNLASECQESSSIDVLRLSHQNEHLKKSLEDLRSSSTKLIELERENRALHQKYLEEKSTVHKLNEELAKAKTLNKQKTEEAEKISKALHSLQNDLHSSSNEVLNLSGELKLKDEAIANLENENYSHVSELQEKLKDAEGKELSMTSLKERVVKNEMQLVALDNKNRDKDMVITEKQRTIEELSDSLHDKDRQIKGLQSRLNESVEDQSKADTIIRKQKKEIAELENRLEEEAMRQKKYEETLKGKENEIVEHTQRFEEIQSTKLRSDDTLKKKDKELHDLKNKLQAAIDECERYKDTLNGKDQKIVSLQKRVEDLLKTADENSETFSQNIREKDKQNRHFERRIEELMESVSEVDKMKESIKQKDDKINNLVKSFNEKEDLVRDIESRLEDASSEINKLGHTIKLKDKKIEALESSLTEIETSSFVVKDDRVTEMKRTVEVRDNKIVELENRVEDLTSLNNKLQHNIKLKESRMTDLELRVEEIESLTFEKNRLTQNLEQKMKQIIDLESSLEDFKDENLRLQHNLTQKSNKVKEFESRFMEIESYVELSQSLQQTLNNKDEKMSALNSNLQDKEEQIAELENGLKESQAQIHKLKHIIKIKDEKILALENRIEELESAMNDSKKLVQMNQSKEDKIKALENKLEELDGVTTTNEKLQKSLSQKEEKINRLQERLDDVEDAVSMNNKLNQHLKNRDNKIKVLGKRILELEDAVERKEKEQISNAQTSYTKIRELETSLELLKSVKVQRQNSVKRREDKIYNLEHQKTQLEEYVQEREAKVVALQSKLDGSVDRYRQMDMTIGAKEMKIAELEAKLSEANEACRENNKLSQMLKAKDARLTELDNKIQVLESSSSKSEKRDQERSDKLEILQKRLEETLNLNNKLDKSVRKKEENIRILERTLQANEKREEELQVLLETRTEKLSESKNRVIELNDVIEIKDNEIDELNKRLSELCNATTSDQKTTTLLKEKDNQLQQMAERLEDVESDKNKILRTLKIKDKEIEDLEQRATTKTVRQHETRVTILTQSNKKLEDNMFSLESQLEESNSQINHLSRKLEQKDERIKGLKNRLEEAVHQNNKLTNALDLKEDKIRAVEERLGDASKQVMQLREENQSRATGREKDNKQGKASSTIIFKPAYNSRDDRKTVHMLSVADKRIADLNDEIRVLEKQNATIKTQSEGFSSRNAQLQIENESLHNELRLVRGDFMSLQSELNEARDYYHQLDLSAINMGHRCEMLSQLNATLEEENKALHDKVSWLMGQNRELMVKNLEEKDQFMEEERLFSDRLYSLQRTKEKLEEQIDLANKALSETPKKKPGFFKKIFKKSGPSKKKEDVKASNKSQVQLLRVDYHDNVEKGAFNRNAEQYEDSVSFMRAPSDYFDESSSSSIGGDSGRSSKGVSNPSLIHSQTSVADTRQKNYSSVMSPQEEIQSRKVSHDISAFRARQVRSEIFNDNFQAGQLSRPKSLDNLNKISGFRGSTDTLSSASAVTIDNVPSKNVRKGRKTPPSSSPPGSAFRVVQRSNGSPYSTPISARKSDARRSSPPIEIEQARNVKESPDSSQYGTGPRASSPSPSGSRSRRSSFSSAVSGHESDHELEKKEEAVSSKRSSIAERTPPPYHTGLNSSFRHNKSDEVTQSPQARRSNRGPPPPYQKPMDETKQDETSIQSSERRPPPYPEAAKSQGFKRTPSIRSKSGTPREDLPPYKRNSSSFDKGTSPREEQRPRSNQSTPQFHRTEPLSMDVGSPISKQDSSIDDEPEILIDATQSTVSAVPVATNSSDQTKDEGRTVISTFFKPVEILHESPLRRMNSMPRYNSRSKSMEESQGRTKRSVKTSDTLFAAVLVRQRSLSDDPRRSRDLSSELSRSDRQPQAVLNSTNIDNDQTPKASGSLDTAQQSHDEDGKDAASVVSTGSHEESGSEGRSKSKSGSRTPLRGKNTHQWLEYGCV